MSQIIGARRTVGQLFAQLKLKRLFAYLQDFMQTLRFLLPLFKHVQNGVNPFTVDLVVAKFCNLQTWVKLVLDEIQL